MRYMMRMGMTITAITVMMTTRMRRMAMTIMVIVMITGIMRRPRARAAIIRMKVRG